jgi:heme/copper-type cytochrome/quinol oxidase subunit 1
MTHNNLFIAFTLSVILSTNICFSAQETFKYDSWVTRLLNKMPDSIINIMHKLTPKDALLLAGGTAAGLIGLFIYYKNKNIQETPETAGIVDALTQDYITNATDTQMKLINQQKRLLHQGKNMKMQYQTESKIKKTMQHRIENQ